MPGKKSKITLWIVLGLAVIGLALYLWPKLKGSFSGGSSASSAPSSSIKPGPRS